MSSNQVTSTDPTLVNLLKTSSSSNAGLAFSQLVSVLAQVQADPKSVSQQDLSALASSVGSATTGLQQTMTALANQMASGGSSSSLQAAYQQAADLLGEIGSHVGRLNNALYTGNSGLRLSGSPATGYTAQTVNMPNDGGAGNVSPSNNSLLSDSITQNVPGGGLSINTAAVQALQGTPVGNILSAVVQGLVNQVQSGQLDAATGLPTSSSSGFNQAEYQQMLAKGTQAGGANPLLKPLVDFLGDYLKQQAAENGGSSNSKNNKKTTTQGASTQNSDVSNAGGGDNSAGGANNNNAGGNNSGGNNNTTTAGTQTQPSSGGAGGAGNTTNNTTGGNTTNNTTGGNNKLTTNGGSDTTNNTTDGSPDQSQLNGIGLGSGVDNSGILGNPLMGAANINGYIMAVLLECYNAGQQDLLAEATNLQGLNRAKDGVRAQLAAARKSNSTSTDPGGGNSQQVQDLEDQLTSMGDDAQLEQLNLQNLAQNQQQLLQMLSNFMKNTHDDSMAIIRHIGGG